MCTRDIDRVLPKRCSAGDERLSERVVQFGRQHNRVLGDTTDRHGRSRGAVGDREGTQHIFAHDTKQDQSEDDQEEPAKGSAKAPAIRRLEH